MRACDLMTRPVLTVLPQTPVREAAKVLASNGFTALPVVDEEGELVGIVTEADVMQGRIPVDARCAPAEEPEPADEPPPATVAEVMTTPVIARPGRTDVAELAKFMLRNKLRSIPIVDDRRLIGIITRRDLVRCLARTDLAIAADVRHRLEIYGGASRWQVHVRQGRVTINDEFNDPVDAHVAKIIALAVPGVEFVKVLGAREPAPVPAADRPGNRQAQRPHKNGRQTLLAGERVDATYSR